jgi:hypothetical protein
MRLDDFLECAAGIEGLCHCFPKGYIWWPCVTAETCIRVDSVVLGACGCLVLALIAQADVTSVRWASIDAHHVST